MEERKKFGEMTIQRNIKKVVNKRTNFHGSKLEREIQKS